MESSAELQLSKMDMENANIQLQEYKNQQSVNLSEISSGNVTPVSSDSNTDSPKQSESSDMIPPLETQGYRDLQNDLALKKRKIEN